MPEDGKIETTLSYIQRDISDIKQDIKDLKGEYASVGDLGILQEKVSRLEKLVYGVISLVLTAVTVGVLKLVTLGG